jgi:hypothetical protein
MRRSITAVIFAGSLMGCTAAQITQLQTEIDDIMAYTDQLCHFVPEVGTIVGLINAGAGATVTAIGTAICNAIGPNPAPAQIAVMRATPMTVNGVPIHGYFTNGRGKI